MGIKAHPRDSALACFHSSKQILRLIDLELFSKRKPLPVVASATSPKIAFCIIFQCFYLPVLQGRFMFHKDTDSAYL